MSAQQVHIHPSGSKKESGALGLYKKDAVCHTLVSRLDRATSVTTHGDCSGWPPLCLALYLICAAAQPTIPCAWLRLVARAFAEMLLVD